MADIFAFDDIQSEIDAVDTASQSPSGLSRALRREAVAEEEAHEINDTVSELPRPIPTANNLNVVNDLESKYGISPSQSRLGSSYEVGIDEHYESSFAPPDVGAAITTRKMSPLDFEHLKVLGEGAYGKVLLVKHKSSGRLFAQKQLKKASMVVEKKKIESAKNERSILESVRHPYIVRLFYALQDYQKLYLILEYAQGGELFHHLAMERMLSEDVASFYIAEMALALHHLHVNVGVVYRDLKPENCLLDAEGHLVLTDFGLSKVATDDGCKTFLGTPEYMAPEVLEGKEYDYAVDWWSLGAVCYDLLTGNPPFCGNNYQKIIEKIKKTKLNLPYYLSPDAKDFLTRLLRKEPKKRLVGHKSFDAFKKHRFFRKIDWKKLESRDPSIVPPIVPVITDPALAENFSDSFTSRPVTPEDGESIPIPKSEDNHVFTGFSFTASQSYIERAIPI